MQNGKGLTLFTLILLITGAVDSIRNLPAAALFGPSLIFTFLIAAFIFLIPAALISAQLAARPGTAHGVYHWTRAALGDHFAFIAIWLQWVSNLVWFPTILSFIGGALAWLISPTLAQNKLWLVSIILSLFWSVTFINLRGIRVSAWFASFCAITGLIIPVVVILILTGLWLLSGKPLHIHFTMHNTVPNPLNPQSWVSLTAIMTSFLGIELAAVHARDIANPQKNFPRALGLSVIVILVTMITGSLAIAIVLPQNEISLVNGVLQAFSHFFAVWHLAPLMPIMTGMIIIGSIGGIISWTISPARGLLQAGEANYLPPFLRTLNRHGVARNLLITQAMLVTLFCLAFLVMPSINGSYWLLTSLNTQLYTLMYVILFIGAFKMARDNTLTPTSGFTIPGGKWGLSIVCVIGLFGCILTEVIGFLPPETINTGSAMHYEMIFVTSMIILLLPALLLCLYRDKREKIALSPNIV